MNGTVRDFQDDVLAQNLKEMAEWALDMTGACNKVPELVRARDLLRDLLEDRRLPQHIRRKLQPILSRIYTVLNRRSRDKAQELLQHIAYLLESAEEDATDPRLPADIKLRSTRWRLNEAEDLLEFDPIEVPRHVLYVGLPAVARESKITVDKLVADLKTRAKAIRVMIPELETAVQYEVDHAVEIADKKQAEMELARQRREEEDRLRQQEMLKNTRERELAAMARRCPEAAKAAQQFYHNLSLGNLGAAKANLNQIQRLDGGLPVQLQTDYAKALQQESFRAICA